MPLDERKSFNSVVKEGKNLGGLLEVIASAKGVPSPGKYLRLVVSIPDESEPCPHVAARVDSIFFSQWCK